MLWISFLSTCVIVMNCKYKTVYLFIYLNPSAHCKYSHSTYSNNFFFKNKNIHFHWFLSHRHLQSVIRSVLYLSSDIYAGIRTRRLRSDSIYYPLKLEINKVFFKKEKFSCWVCWIFNPEVLSVFLLNLSKCVILIMLTPL